MNIQVSAKAFTSAAEIKASAIEVHKRLISPPTARIAPAALPVPVRRRAYQLDKRPKDAHVLAWKIWKTMIGARPCRDYIRDRCAQLEVDFNDVLGPSRNKEISFIRHLLMWEIKTKIRREMSYPEIGRIFGGRDHTSVIFACRKIQEMIDGCPNDFMERKRKAIIEYQRKTA